MAASKSKSWHKDLNASSLFGRWPWKHLFWRGDMAQVWQRSQQSVCYRSSYSCGQPRHNPAEELWGTMQNVPQRCTTWRLRKLRYLSSTPICYWLRATLLGIISPGIVVCLIPLRGCKHFQLHAVDFYWDCE